MVIGQVLVWPSSGLAKFWFGQVLVWPSLYLDKFVFGQVKMFGPVLEGWTPIGGLFRLTVMSPSIESNDYNHYYSYIASGIMIRLYRIVATATQRHSQRNSLTFGGRNLKGRNNGIHHNAIVDAIAL